MKDEMLLQRKEFDAADAFAEALRNHGNTAIVDDDYPQVRHEYEGALAAMLDAMKANGRFDGAVNRYGLCKPESIKPVANPAHATLTFDAFRAANVTRCAKWHPQGIDSWSPSDWMTAVMGELGELASLLKMRNRERDGLPGNKFSPTDQQIADELADVLTYLDLLAASLFVNLGRAAARKFNEVSERVGFPDRISYEG